MKRLPAFLAACLLACPAGAHEGHRAAAATRSELGSSAAFDPTGRLWVASKSGDHVVLQHSDDQGRSWSFPAPVNSRPEAVAADGEDRPRLAFAGDGALLVSWTQPLAKPYTGAIRLARAADGEHLDAPVTVHRDREEITHRFGSLKALPDGQVVVAWIDKRDLEAAKAGRKEYRGAAIYAAVSDDGGRSFRPEQKVADHSCECCRLAVTADADGAPLVLWRHLFSPNQRDHALARLTPDGRPEKVQRATFDRWQIDACPHHGPALAVDGKGMRHAVWFNAGQVFYGRLIPDGDGLAVAGQRPVGGPRAAHADIGAAGGKVAIAWKEFDGEATRLHALISADGGDTFAALGLAATAGASDQPRVIPRGDALYAFWRTEKEGFRLFPLP